MVEITDYNAVLYSIVDMAIVGLVFLFTGSIEGSILVALLLISFGINRLISLKEQTMRRGKHANNM
jgi:hypothetical protein